MTERSMNPPMPFMMAPQSTRQAIRVVAAGAHHVSLALQGEPAVAEDVAQLDINGALPGGAVLHLLIDLEGFSGWDPYAVAHAIWQRANASPNHSKLAILCGSDVVQQLMIELAKPLFSDRVKVFAAHQRAIASAWLSTPSLSIGLLPVSSHEPQLS